MSAEELAFALSGKRQGKGWLACCPAHDDHDPSLSIGDGDDGRILVHCHAGCPQSAVIDALRRRGLWPTSGMVAAIHHARLATRPLPASRDHAGYALKIWQSSVNPAGTLVEGYLAGRGLVLPERADLRHHHALKHEEGGNWPGMVALATDSQTELPLAIHRTFLSRSGGKAPVGRAKMMLGPCRGGVVRLAKAIPGQQLLIGEGIETTLAAMQATGLPGWAALSAGGMTEISLPADVTNVTLLADGDRAGQQAAARAAERLASTGVTIHIAHASEGSDFNDLLLDQFNAGAQGGNEC